MGALGIYVVADTITGMAIACKTEDGNPEANRVLLLESMYQAGMVDDGFMVRLKRHARPVIMNSHKHIVGYSKPVFKLIKNY